MRLRLRFVVMVAIVIAARHSFACTCGGIHGKDLWDTARVEAESATAIFEGTPTHFELRWNVLNAKDGELVPAYDPGGRTGWPRMAITFQVTKVYKGEIGNHVVVTTGLGGGDCGARYSVGITYLVYADGSRGPDLRVGLCSPGGWIGDDAVALELRYLTHQTPPKAALAPAQPLWMRSGAAEKERQHSAEESKKRYAYLTGVICGTVVPQADDSRVGRISFLSNEGFSPIDHPDVSVNDDGSFCSQRLGPGKYYLLFTRSDFLGKPVFLYYPGVNEKKDAVPLDVVAGRTSTIKFNLPLQKTYSVHFLVSTNDKSRISGNDVQVILINLDHTIWYIQPANFEGFWPLPKTKYLTFTGVPPGHYVAFASVLGRDWMTRKVDVNVTTHSKLISLDIVHKN